MFSTACAYITVTLVNNLTLKTGNIPQITIMEEFTSQLPDWIQSSNDKLISGCTAFWLMEKSVTSGELLIFQKELQCLTSDDNFVVGNERKIV